jgi:hypothetical protein
MWHKALDELGEKVCELYPFLCELCHEKGHFNFQCSGHNNDLSHPMRTAIVLWWQDHSQSAWWVYFIFGV